ncbi:MAG: SAM-dependent methyltransferase [Alphaproteobacteria bacterium]|jgi:SAM-dependent methyltransferase
MKVNTLERLFVNSPIRRFFQKHWEVPALIKLGGKPNNGSVAEIGCGSGYGVKLIHEQFHPSVIHAFEIDEIMLKKASSLLAKEIMAHKVFLHEENDDMHELVKNSYANIFFFGSLHHIPGWQKALKASIQSLDKGGKIYLGEYYKPLITNAFFNKIFHHKAEAAFTHDELLAELENNDCKIIGEKNLFNLAGLMVVEKK